MHREHEADLILTDLIMNEMNGAELIRRVRESSPRTVIIAMSGAPGAEMYLNVAKGIGADRVLAKPFSPEMLVQTVDEVLAAHAKPASRRAADGVTSDDAAISAS